MIFNRSNKLAIWLVTLFFAFNLVEARTENPNRISPFKRDILNNSQSELLTERSADYTSRQSVLAKDTLKRAINREANRASLMSAILPGLGQVYNKKYWKVPIIYAALGGIAYFAWGFNNDYQNYHHELLFRYDHNLTQVNTYPEYTVDNLITLKNQSKKYRDLCFIGMGIFYVLNIIDANVDGHLKKFDVNDNLTMGIAPRALFCANSPYHFAPGISLALHFK